MDTRLMTQAEFAKFCGLSRQMISKYGGQGLLAMRGGKVDARATLVGLEGRMRDDARRRALIARLDGIAETAAAPSLAPVEVEESASGDGDSAPSPATSWKARKDRADAQLRELELLERQGLLVDAAEVRAAVEDTIATFWSEVDRRQRLDVEEAAGLAKLTAEQGRALRDWLVKRDRRLRAAFAAALRARAGELAPELHDAA